MKEKVVNVILVSAFAKTKKGGNPAGVVLDADELSTLEKQKIAMEVGLSETAFVQKSHKADFKIEFFTPNEEVELCGHATIATFSILYQLGMIQDGNYTQETKAGILGIHIKGGKVFMEQKEPTFFDIVNIKEITDSLNITTAIIDTSLPIQIVATGGKDILIPIKTLKDIDNIIPNFNAIIQVSKKYNVVGYHLFCLDTKKGTTAYCRDFAPLFDIPEEPATGTSNGALACYLYKYGKISLESPLIFEQGYYLKKPSEIIVKLETQNNIITKVIVGGMTVGNLKKEIRF